MQSSVVRHKVSDCHLRALEHLLEVETLDVSGNKISLLSEEEEVLHLGEVNSLAASSSSGFSRAYTFPKLTTLALNANNLSQSVASVLNCPSIRHVRSLFLMNNRIGGFVIDAEKFQLTRLESLNLAGNSLSSTSAFAILTSPCLTAL